MREDTTMANEICEGHLRQLVGVKLQEEMPDVKQPLLQLLVFVPMIIKFQNCFLD